MIRQSDSKQQQRVIIAVALSFLFFIVYSEFFMKPQFEQNATVNATTADNISQNVQNAAPKLNAATQNQALNTQVAAPSSSTQGTQNIIAKIKSEHFEASIDYLGRISSFKLLDAKYKDENSKFVEVIPSKAYTLPLELRFIDTKVNDLAFKTPYIADKKELVIDANSSATLSLTQNLDGLVVTKTLTFYELGNYDVDVKLSANSAYFISPGSRPAVAVDNFTVHGALLLDNQDTIHTYEDGDVDSDENLANINVASAFDRYYSAFFYNFATPLNITVSKDNEGNSVLFAYSQNEFKSGGYIGAKEHSILRAIDERLDVVVEYGWFTFIAKPMFDFLNFLHTYIGNWGWAIVVMTLIVRLVLFPLTYKSMISMNKLKDLAPKMKDIRDKYKGDPQKMNMHMMELYKKHGANPMAGCLPILLQIPIFFAIYRVLLNAIELKSAPWALWINDLSVMDPYFILPILMGLTMFLQQHITPMAIQDPLQAKIMKYLPLVFILFFITFPAGLTLYWFINNLCSLIQQWVINKLFEKEHKHKESENTK